MFLACLTTTDKHLCQDLLIVNLISYNYNNIGLDLGVNIWPLIKKNSEKFVSLKHEYWTRKFIFSALLRVSAHFIQTKPLFAVFWKINLKMYLISKNKKKHLSL